MRPAYTPREFFPARCIYVYKGMRVGRNNIGFVWTLWSFMVVTGRFSYESNPGPPGPIGFELALVGRSRSVYRENYGHVLFRAYLPADMGTSLLSIISRVTILGTAATSVDFKLDVVS